MGSFRWLTGRVVLCAVLAVLASFASGDPLIRSIGEFQTASGGFHENGEEKPSLPATTHALFLSSLYGLQATVNVDDAAQFVKSLASPANHGYAPAPGLPSDIQSTVHALAAYKHLGQQIPNAAQVGDFVLSLFRVESGLFGSREGEQGDVRSTALAIEALDILGQLQKPVVQDALKRIKEMLAGKVAGTETLHFSFDPASPTPLSDNYFGLVLAKYSEYEFADKEKWSLYITNLQEINDRTNYFGAFFTSEKKDALSTESTLHAAQSLSILGAELGARGVALSKFAQLRKNTIRDTALSHHALALTPAFKSSLKPVVGYDGGSSEPVDTHIPEGLVLTPQAFVSQLDGKSSNGGFKVSVTDGRGFESDLPLSLDLGGYIGDQYDTTGKLGDVTFSYTFTTNVYPIGEITIDFDDERQIGYIATVEDVAVFGGRKVEEGENVLPGTEFSFSLALGTVEDDDFVSGDFVVDLSVRDSSGVTQSKQSIDGASNSAPLEFAYSLTGDDFPSGAVTFQFDVSNKDGVHTTKLVTYPFEQQMVASNIAFSDQSGAEIVYSLGDRVKITMQPGTLKDLHSTSSLSASNAGERAFMADFSSSQGVFVLSVPGEAVNEGDSASYSFETTLPASLDFIGDTVVSFRYVAADGTSVKLHPFDLESSELVEDTQTIQFSVNADLRMVDVEDEPTEAEYTYGAVIPLKFKVEDSLTGKSLKGTQKSEFAIALVSGEGAGSVESTRLLVAPVSSVFARNVEIDGNTLAGPTVLKITAVGVDGQDIPIRFAERDERVVYSFKVGGDIEVSSETYTTSSPDSSRTAFIVSFSLSCAGQPLKNTKLKATVNFDRADGAGLQPAKRNGVELVQLPVTFDESATATALYSFSFTSEHAQSLSGSYAIVFFRDIDVSRAALGGTAAEPLFEVNVSHERVEKTGMWMQMELISILVLGAVYLGVSSHKKLFDKKLS